MRCYQSTKRVAEKRVLLLASVLLESLLVAFLLIFLVAPSAVLAGVGANVTVVTQLQVGNVFPEITSIVFLNSTSSVINSVDLSPNATTNVTLYVIARDFNGENDITNITARFFDQVSSTYAAADDNNRNYNVTCTRDVNYGDIYEVNISCVFPVWYYANNATWNGTININDSGGYQTRGSNTTTVNRLLALGVASILDYGQVNATLVSWQNITNVTNFGNTIFNLSLEGYAVVQGDNLSMNCTLGAIKNISIGHEKYNLTSSNVSTVLSLAAFEAGIYRNLTSNPTVNTYNLAYRTNDTVNDAYNTTYWRIYVPTGVAGTCRGNIIFGAALGAGS